MSALEQINQRKDADWGEKYDYCGEKSYSLHVRPSEDEVQPCKHTDSTFMTQQMGRPPASRARCQFPSWAHFRPNPRGSCLSDPSRFTPRDDIFRRRALTGPLEQNDGSTATSR